MVYKDLKKKYLKEKYTGVGNEIRDDYHTMSELYFNRLILFSILCSLYKDRAWKSKFHDDGNMYPNYFIVGIDTPEGQFTYHYDLKYWDLFLCKELEKAPKYDGHKSEDIVRLFSLI